ncbi:S-layer protein [Secundilactobacillus yichangensis]|uniref:S-layer protein n=1 Tax=Secundilactobacillus yichangensis TaxID=2799580 RepID=UPI001943CA1E|nr:S-layer protein [Secundilactobacillus yichangensis]
MKSSLKKSLYVGLTAASMFGAAGLASTTASAKSGAYIVKTSYFKTAPESRNVAPNGDNALYTKVGTSKGARVVASKATMNKLSSSNKSSDYFRAYAIVTTNRGSVYYKIVSFDGKYRGWIYGGKNVGRFSGGLQAADTTEKADMPTVTTGYTLANPSKYTLWNNPQYTQYKASKVKGFSNTDTFTITGAETKSREGWVYYQVKDDQNPSITGWIYSSGVQAPQSQNAVKISYIDKSTGKEVGTGSVPFDKSATTANLTTGANYTSVVNGIPSGYVAYTSGAASFVNQSAAASAKSNDTVAFYVSKNSASDGAMMSIRAYTMNGDPITLTATDSTTLDAAGRNYDFQVAKGQPLSSSQVSYILDSVSLKNLTAQNGQKYTFDHADPVDGSQTQTGFVNVKAYYRAN